MNWLFVTTCFPWPLTHGTWLRVYHLTSTIHKQGDHVALLTYHGDQAAEQKYTQAGITLVNGLTGGGKPRGKSRSLLAPYVYDPNLARSVANRAGDHDIVVLAHLNCLQYSPEADGAERVVADIVDDPILEWQRRLRHETNPIRLFENIKFQAGVRVYEKAFIDPVDLVTFVSEQDTRSFARRNTGKRVAAMPNGVDIDYFANPNPGNTGPHTAGSILFMGNMSHMPNEDAALFLIRQIAPRVWKQRPEAQFVIAGCEPAKPVRDLAGPRVRVTGWVDDLRPMLWNATAVVLPMRIGTGIKNKLLEAWAAGIPVIATPLACQGVPAEHEKNILLAKSPKELADTTIRLINDRQLARQLARHGRETVNDMFTWQIAAQRFREGVMDRKA